MYKVSITITDCMKLGDLLEYEDGPNFSNWFQFKRHFYCPWSLFHQLCLHNTQDEQIPWASPKKKKKEREREKEMVDNIREKEKEYNDQRMDEIRQMRANMLKEGDHVKVTR